MKTFYWLVKREFWEHRGGFLWAPLITAAVIVVLNIMSIIAGEVVGGRHWSITLIWQKLDTASPEDMRQLASVLDFSALVPTMIVSIVLFFVLLGYCMKTLSNDRADRSILFWKSLPVSDTATVLSKAFSAVIVAPVIATAVGIISVFAMLLPLAITATFHGASFSEVMWGLPHIGNLMYVAGGLLPVYIIWMLPSVGWLLLCSAWTRGKTMRWAVLLPIAVGAVISWLSLMGPLAGAASWYWRHVVLRILLGILPGSWTWSTGGNDIPLLIIHSGHSMEVDGFSNFFSNIISSQYPLLGTPDFLWGILAGFVMIGIAVWLRRWRTEL